MEVREGHGATPRACTSHKAHQANPRDFSLLGLPVHHDFDQRRCKALTVCESLVCLPWPSAQCGARSAGPFAYLLRTRGVREAGSLECVRACLERTLRISQHLPLSGSIAIY